MKDSLSDGVFYWDQYFMTMCYLVATKSKDPSTKVGAIIVGPQKEVRATGYNGFPRGVDDAPERYSDRDYKYLICNHAEENAILSCAMMGVSTQGCALYVTWMPCSHCAKSIIQAGITEVIYHEAFPGNHVVNQSPNWVGSMRMSQQILAEANVGLRSFDGDLVNITSIYQGRSFSLPFAQEKHTSVVEG